MTKFRTHQEMGDVYQQRSEQGKEDQPYVLEYQAGDQNLIFFGTRHSADPSDKQWEVLDENWAKFLASPNNKKQVYCEGMVRPIEGMSRDEAIKRHSDTGLTCWLAGEAGLPLESPEPDRKAEIDYMKEQGVSYEQIINYYFGRQMRQWLEQDRQNDPDWRAYATKTLNHYQAVHDWGGLSLDLVNVLAIYKQQTGKDFSENDKQQLYSISDPGQNRASSVSSQYRDICLFDAIKEKWQLGYDIFVVYGSGHAIVLEPALKDLTI